MAAAYSNTPWHSYLLPACAALGVHVLLAFIIAGGFASAPERKLVQPSKVIQARLVELKPQKQVARPVPAPKPAPKAQPAPVKEVASKPAEPRPKQAEKKETKKDQARERPDPALQREADRQRMQQLLAQEEAELAAAEEFEQVAAYVAAMRVEIASHWSRPPSARNYMEVLLSIRLLPNGDVVSVAVKKSSGNPALDRSAVHAVEKVGRFDMLRNMPGSMFDRHFRSIDIVFRPEDLRL